MSTQQMVPAVAGPGRVGQGTAVEQTRAATEVQAAIYLARQYPRDMDAARARMLMACAQPELAEKAFYAYPRGDDTISGLTIDAAVELALCWGNMTYGLTELSRDDVYGQSETLAWAWDLETNVRIANTFIVPHMRDTKKGSYRVKESRDVYEIVSNMGNRRMRAAILKTLPRWFRIQAEDALRETRRRMVEKTDKPLGQQIEEAAGHFLKRFGITVPQIEEWAKKPVPKWETDDLVKLQVLWRTLSRREITLEEAFPQAKVSAAEVNGEGDAPADDAEPGAVLFDNLKRRTAEARSNGDLEGVYAEAKAAHEGGRLTEDQLRELMAAGDEKYRELFGDESDTESAEDPS